MIRQIALPTCTLVGTTGSAAGTAVSSYPIVGELLAAHIIYAGGTSTEDVVVSTTAGSITLLSLANNETTGWYFPRGTACNIYGGTLSLEGNQPQTVCIPICDYVQAVVAAGGTAGNTVDVSLVIRE
jgi:hypothetical protein